jgi:hypothetical protein
MIEKIGSYVVYILHSLPPAADNSLDIAFDGFPSPDRVGLLERDSLCQTRDGKRHAHSENVFIVRSHIFYHCALGGTICLLGAVCAAPAILAL